MSKHQLVKRLEMALALLKTGQADHVRHYLEETIDLVNNRECRTIEELPWRPRAMSAGLR
jgi:hypothetical protein